jgi:hypothetical protein
VNREKELLTSDGMTVNVVVNADRVATSSMVEVDAVTTSRISLDTYDVWKSMEADKVTSEMTVETCADRVEVQASAAVGRYGLALCDKVVYIDRVCGSESMQSLDLGLTDGDGFLINRAEDLSLHDIREADKR